MARVEHDDFYIAITIVPVPVHSRISANWYVSFEAGEVLIVHTRNMKLVRYNGASRVVALINKGHAISDIVDSHGRPVHPDSHGRPCICRVETISCLLQQITEGVDIVLLIISPSWIVPTIL